MPAQSVASLDDRSFYLAHLQSDMHEMGRVFEAGLENGWLRPIVYREYPLEKASEAHEEIIATTSAQGKIVLTM